MNVEMLKKIPVTVGITIICFSSLLYFNLIAKKENILGLSPDGIMEGFLFQLLTTHFIEASFGKVGFIVCLFCLFCFLTLTFLKFKAIVTVPLLVFFGKDLELEMNSTKAFVIYLISVGIASSILTSFVGFFMYVMTYEDHFFVDQTLGLGGTIVAILVRLIKLNKINEN